MDTLLPVKAPTTKSTLPSHFTTGYLCDLFGWNRQMLHREMAEAGVFTVDFGRWPPDAIEQLLRFRNPRFYQFSDTLAIAGDVERLAAKIGGPAKAEAEALLGRLQTLAGRLEAPFRRRPAIRSSCESFD